MQEDPKENQNLENQTPGPEQSAQDMNGDAPEELNQAQADNVHEMSASQDDLVASLQGQVQELKDQLLRNMADMENLRKRSAKEVRDAKQFAISNFARDMLIATDNLSRALMVIPEEERANADGPFKSLIDGIELTEREMQRLLEKNGIQKVTPLNERFDPNFHQAMFEVPNPEVAENTVIEVVQDGYIIGDRILRPAMVGVAKGGPKQTAQASASQGNAGAPDATEAYSQDNPGSENVDRSV